MKLLTARSTRASYRLLFVESALTKVMVVIPVAYIFLNSDLGFSQAQIGYLQGAFALTMIVLQYPTGYLADRFSHKFSNAAGDLALLIGAVVYSLSQNFGGALAAEILLGLGFSLSSGADMALLRSYSKRLKLDYQRSAARITTVGFTAAGLGAVMGGVLAGFVEPRQIWIIQIALFAVAFTIALLLVPSGEQRKSQHPVVHDIGIAAKYLLIHPGLLRRMLLSASLMASTLMIVWFLTPIFFSVGFDVTVHGIFFAMISVAAIIGSRLVESERFRGAVSMSAPLLLCAVVYLFLGVSLSIWVFWLFLLTSFARGINTARISPYIQEITPDDLQASALSLYNVFYKLAAATVVVAVNQVGDSNIQNGLLLASAVCFAMYAIFRVFKEK